MGNYIKSNIAIWGLGNEFKRYRNLIFDLYNVIVCTDTSGIPTDTMLKSIYMPSAQFIQIMQRENDMQILISSKAYYYEIRRDILLAGISKLRILSLDEIEGKVRLKAWIQRGSPIPPPHTYKVQVIRKYATRYGCKTLIESGTFLGDMIFSQINFFEEIISIEIDEELYCRAREKFDRYSHIKLYKGDSGKILEKILINMSATTDTIFWLDGHYSGSITAKGETNTPILKELKHIFQYYKGCTAVILIDDARCFNGEDDYPTITELENFCLKNNYKMVKHFFVLNDIIRCVLRI